MKNILVAAAVIISLVFLQSCYFSSGFGVGSASGSIEGPTIGPYAKSPKQVQAKGTWMEGKKLLVVMNERGYYYFNNENILTLVRNELRSYYPTIVVPSGSGGLYSNDPPALDYDCKVVVTTQDGQSKKIVYLEVITPDGVSGGSSIGEARDFSYRSYLDYNYRDTRVSDEEWHLIAWRNAARAAVQALASLKEEGG
ncbi:MAG TPA: hypothetical protein VJJ73_00970 [Candidatus Paceibacterota bacterium]